MANPFRAFGEFVGISTRSTTVPESPSSPLPGVIPPTRTEAGLSLDRAITLPSVFRAFSLLSSVVSQLEMQVWRGSELVPNPGLIRSPDLDRSLSSFLKRTVTALAASGNAYWVLQRDSADRVIAVDDLDPLSTFIEYDSQNRKRYRNGNRSWPASEVKHLKLLEMPGHDEGVGPIQACRAAFQSALDLRAFGDTWISLSGVPTGVLTTNLALQPDEREAMQIAWHNSLAERKTAVLSQGLKYEPVLISPADAQFLESQSFSVVDVARMFGIPAPLLLAAVEGNSMTYQNMETVDRQFITYTVMLYLKEIEDAFSSLLPRGQVAKFLLSGLLRPDVKAQAEVDVLYLTNGVVSASEVRTARGHTGPPPPNPKAPAPAVAPTTEEPSA